MKKIVAIIALLALMLPITSSAQEREFHEVDFTCYIDRGTCFTGCETRKGIAASSEELIGYTAIVWLMDEKGNPTEVLGYYEILDKIGTKWGRSGTLDDPHVIDVWCEDIEEAKEMMKITKGKVLVQLVWAEG